METFLAVLLALGIFVGIPVFIGTVIGGAAVIMDRRTRKVEKAKAVAEAEKAVRKPARETVVVG